MMTTTAATAKEAAEERAQQWEVAADDGDALLEGRPGCGKDLGVGWVCGDESGNGKDADEGCYAATFLFGGQRVDFVFLGESPAG